MVRLTDHGTMFSLSYPALIYMRLQVFLIYYYLGNDRIRGEKYNNELTMFHFEAMFLRRGLGFLQVNAF
jgi:hypothetical protein